MHAKANAAKAALEALKAGDSAPVPSTPVASAPVAPAPAGVPRVSFAGSTGNEAEILEAEMNVKFIVWAVFAFVGQIIFAQLAAFVASSPSSSSSGRRLRSRVRSAASEAQIDAAKQHADLLQWAARTAAGNGLPAAAAM